GVRTEASGGASTWEPWLAQLEGGHPMDLVHASVVLVGDDAGGLFTCGMHAFGLPEERRRLERWPDHRHHPDDGRHNPFGSWRLLPDEAGARVVVTSIARGALRSKALRSSARCTLFATSFSEDSIPCRLCASSSRFFPSSPVSSA